MANPTAVITGAAGALGGAVARRLTNDGYATALLDVPAAREPLEKLAAELGPKARAYTADLSSAKAWAEVIPAIERDLGPPSQAALIAGGWRGGTPLHASSDDATWDAMMTMNLETAHHALQALLPGMVLRKAGSIVVIGSRATERPWSSANAAAYAASKTAVIALAEAVAAEVLEHGVRINAILPSTMDTRANRRAMPDADPAKWVSLESAAGVIAFLLGDGARDISGAKVPVYGRA